MEEMEAGALAALDNLKGQIKEPFPEPEMPTEIEAELAVEMGAEPAPAAPDGRSELEIAQEEIQHLKGKLGKQGSERGDLLTEMEGMKAQLEGLTAQATPDFGPDDLGKLVDPENYEALKDEEWYQHSLKMTFNGMNLMSNAVEQKFAALNEAQLQNTSGFTSDQVNKLTQDNPWLSRLSGQERLDAMKTLAGPSAGATPTSPKLDASSFVENTGNVGSPRKTRNESSADLMLKAANSGDFKKGDHFMRDILSRSR